MSTVEVFRPKDTLLSAHNAPSILTWVDSALKAGCKTLLIDLEETSFMDSCGLGVLVTALKRVRSAGARLAICSLNGQAKLLFALTNMEAAFEVYTNVDEFSQCIG